MNEPKPWADLTERERRLLTLISGAHLLLNLVENEIDGGGQVENMPGGRRVAREMDHARRNLAEFSPLDIMDLGGEPNYDGRAAGQASIWAEVLAEEFGAKDRPKAARSLAKAIEKVILEDD